MNLKELLLYELKRLYTSPSQTPPVQREWKDLWFVKVWDILQGRRPLPIPGRSPITALKIQAPEYRPGIYYHTRRRRWRGPFYFLMSHWRRDLLDVMDQIGAIVRVNAPLPQGLEAAACEENRLNRGFKGRRIKHLSQALFVTGILTLLGVYASFSIADFNSDLSILVFLGISFVAGLIGIIMLRRGGRREAILLFLRDALASGESLSEAMRRFPRFFPVFYADMVQAGEDSGQLSSCLEQLGEDTLRGISLAKGMLMNVIYLVGLFTVQCTLISFIAIKIIPVFREILYEFDSELPGPARSTVYMIDNMIGLMSGRYAFWTALVCMLAVVVVLYAMTSRRLKRRARFSSRTWPAFLLAIPWVQGLIVRQNMCAIARMLQKLLGAGMPLDRALESASKAELNPLYSRTVRSINRRIVQGESFSVACASESGAGLIPASFRGFTALGEQSGMLPEALGRIADIYQSEAEKRIRILSDLVLPLGVLCLGAVTLMIELTLFMTMTSIVDSLMLF